MKEFVNKIIPALITALIVAVVTTWFTNARELEENKSAIIKIAEDVDKIEKSHKKD